MRLQIDPLADVFFVRDLPDDELLAEVLVVHDVRSVTDYVFDLAGR